MWRCLTLVLAFVLGSLRAAPADSAAPSAYPGLLSEMRSADMVVLVKAERAEGSPERDPETGTLLRLKVEGQIAEVYKGDAWHDRIPAVQQIGSLIPLDLLQLDPAQRDETLATAKAFAGR